MDRFGVWVKRVKQEAKAHGYLFVLECFEGNERNNIAYADGMEVQDLSGFLLTNAQARQHSDIIHTDSSLLHDIPDALFVFVTWAMDGDTLEIIFERACQWAAPQHMVFHASTQTYA